MIAFLELKIFDIASIHRDFRFFRIWNCIDSSDKSHIW